MIIEAREKTCKQETSDLAITINMIIEAKETICSNSRTIKKQKSYNINNIDKLK